MCISNENYHGLTTENIPSPEIGDIVTVIGEGIFCGVVDCYKLLEYTCPSPIYEWGFDKRNFAPLSDIDETELVNEKQEVYA